MMYLLNIKQGAIHNANIPCAPAKRMIKANQKFFEYYEDAESYYEGG